MSAFDRVREGGFSALDIALMESLRVIWPASSAAALHLAGLNSWAVGKGHSCFKPELLDDWPDGQDSALHAQLRAGTWPQAGFIGEASSALPIIVESNRSWLRRYWRHEREVETALLQRAQPAPVTSNAAEIARALDVFLPASDAAQTDWQRVAAAMALRAPLSVICGGPGTGKTHTALRLLALHLRLSDKPLRMALAAPTGKAAQRLAESVQAGLDALPLSAEERDALPSAAKTLHRLLGFRPQSVSPLRDADYPLDLDVLIVDECSMVDLPLMAKLLRALKPECRLILLGDPDQLPAVENGAVLATVATSNGSNAFSASACKWLADAKVARLDPIGEQTSVGDCVVRLERAHRFAGESGIARLVGAIRRGDEDAVFDALASSADIRWSEQALAFDTAQARDAARAHWAGLAAADSPQAALAQLGRYRILCAVREGPQGVAGLNQAIGSLLHGASSAPLHVSGRPILVSSNEHALGLYNGDVGILLAEHAGGSLRAWFTRRDGGLLRVLPTQLPAHESAYAMTVHKAQGSEFDVVELVLPQLPHPLITREWLYTAASRARRKLHVHASREVIRAALPLRTRRINGLDFSEERT